MAVIFVLPRPRRTSAQARGAGRAGTGRHATGDQFIAFVELAFQHLRDFSDGVVRDPGANPYRFEGFVGT